MALGLILPLLLNPTEVFLLTVGYTLVLAVIFVYVDRKHRRRRLLLARSPRRVQLDPALHLPRRHEPRAASTRVYKAFNPLPVYPYNWSPFIVIGWLIVGIGVILSS